MTSASHAEGRQFDPGLVYFKHHHFAIVVPIQHHLPYTQLVSQGCARAAANAFANLPPVGTYTDMYILGVAEIRRRRRRRLIFRGCSEYDIDG